MNIPIVQLRTQPLIIGIDTARAKNEIEQPRAEFKLDIKDPVLYLESPRGDLDIDQSRAWDALAIGDHMETMSTIYAILKNMALSAIGRVAQEGDQLIRIHTGVDAIANNAVNRSFDTVGVDFAGPASVDNVDIYYTERKVEMDSEKGDVFLEAAQNRARLNYVEGSIQYHIKQYNKLEMTPPKIDLQV